MMQDNKLFGDLFESRHQLAEKSSALEVFRDKWKSSGPRQCVEDIQRKSFIGRTQMCMSGPHLLCNSHASTSHEHSVH